MPELVWYASYGSNLNYQNRFLCYIRGGKPSGSEEENPGCRDKTPPRDNKPISLNFDLYFAYYSGGWGGGVAFIKRGSAASKTLGRMYLIAEEQFNDVILQENSREVDGTRLLPPLAQLAAQNNFVLPGNGLYSRLLWVGADGGYPVFTFSSVRDDLPLHAPSEAYVTAIVSGIKETYPSMTDSQICHYLLRSEGISGRISPDTITAWVRAAK